MTRSLLLLLTLSLITAPVYGVDLRATPVQTGFQQELQSDALAGLETWQTDNVFEDDRESDTDEFTGQKSVLRAGLYSLLLPGMGEYYVGHKSKARVFFTAEALTWIGFVGFTVYGNWKEGDLERFAAERANADLEGKDDFFQDMVGFYDDIDQYNSLGRATDPDRPYLPDTPEYHWRWQSQRDQDIYRDLKNRSREAFRRADFMIGVAIVNRVVSVIDAVRDAKRAQRRIGGEFGDSGHRQFEFDINPLSSHRQVSLTLYTDL